MSHGHVQHSGASFNKENTLQCHNHDVLELDNLKDTIALAWARRLVAVASFLRRMVVRHPVRPVMSRNRTVWKAVVTLSTCLLVQALTVW